MLDGLSLSSVKTFTDVLSSITEQTHDNKDPYHAAAMLDLKLGLFLKIASALFK